MPKNQMTWLAIGAVIGVVAFAMNSPIRGQVEDVNLLSKWEYEVKSLSGIQYEHEKELNDLGNEGWELVTATPNPAKFHTEDILFILKRRVQ